jgi:predicted dehydrogenase
MTAPTIIQTAQLPRVPRPIVSIGAGGIVHDAHYPAYQKAGFPVVGLYDRNPERTQLMATKFNVPTVYSSIRAAAQQAPSDAVFDVAVPASNILDVLRALPDRRAVLIQKPLGDNLVQGREIVALCQQKGLIAAVNFQMRYAPFILAARSLIDQGVIGAVHDMEVRVTVYTPWHLWSFLEAVPKPEIWYHSIHYMDLVRSFLGEPQGVYCKSTRHPEAAKLDGTRTTLIFDYGDLLRANVTTNHHHKYGLQHQESYVKWEGENGAIKVKLGLLMNYPTGVPDAFEYCVLHEGQEPEWRSVAIDGTWFPDAFIGSMASLMCFVEGSSPVLPTTVTDAIRTMAVADAAVRSHTVGATALDAI